MEYCFVLSPKWPLQYSTQPQPPSKRVSDLVLDYEYSNSSFDMFRKDVSDCALNGAHCRKDSIECDICFHYYQPSLYHDGDDEPK